jgi:hypothetical protein
MQRKTRYGNNLTVVGELYKHDGKRNRKYVKVECDICSKDLELFNEPFITRQSTYTSGGSPCPCCGHFTYSLEQIEVLIKRKAGSDYTFKDWFKVPKEGNLKQAYPVLFCNKHHEAFHTTSAYEFLHIGSIGCPECKGYLCSVNQLIDDDTMNKRFHEAGIPKEIRLRRNSKDTSMWDYECPTCSNDEYVLNDVCSGVFTTHVSSLLKVAVSCRCIRGYLWSEDQQLYRVKKALYNNNPKHIFIGFVDKYVNSNSKVMYECGGGHGIREVEITSLVNRKTDCRKCSLIKNTNNFGRYSKRLHELDHLYFTILSNKDENFIKIGRAFDIELRFSFYKPLFDIEVIHIHEGIHKEVFLLEKEILQKLSYLSYKPITAFGGDSECFCLEHYQKVKEYFDEILKL